MSVIETSGPTKGLHRPLPACQQHKTTVALSSQAHKKAFGIVQNGNVPRS